MKSINSTKFQVNQTNNNNIDHKLSYLLRKNLVRKMNQLKTEKQAPKGEACTLSSANLIQKRATDLS
jgi:hypothetical protein